MSVHKRVYPVLWLGGDDKSHEKSQQLLTILSSFEKRKLKQ